MSLEDDFGIALKLGYIGFAHVDAQMRVLARHGSLSFWLPLEGSHCAESPVLFGLEDDLRQMQLRGGGIKLPSVHVPEFGDNRRADVVIEWDPARELYVVITTANFEADEMEALLTAERRNKQISDERLIAETERANVQTRINAVEQERARIARDLHDTLVQSMVAVLMQVRLVLKMMRPSPGQALLELYSTEETARAGLDKAREALSEIRSRTVDAVTLGTAIRNALTVLRSRLQIEVNLAMDPAADDLHGNVATGVARIFEEALRNIERHARARTLDVELRLENAPTQSALRLSIRDDGIGFDAGLVRPGHFGLVGMIEQAELLGGVLSIESRPEAGTKIEMKAPLVMH